MLIFIRRAINKTVPQLDTFNIFVAKSKTLMIGLCPNFNVAFCEPPVLRNGRLQFSDNKGKHDVRSTVTYSCNRGFELSDKIKTRRCLESRQWSGTAPTCTRKYLTKFCIRKYFAATFTLGVDCVAPRVSENGYYNGQTTYQSMIEFGCNKGYYIDGATTARCLHTREWDNKAPKCQSKSVNTRS